MKNRPQERGQEPDGLACRKTFTAVCSFHARMQTILHFEPVVWRIAPPCSVFRKRTEPSRDMKGDPQEGEGGGGPPRLLNEHGRRAHVAPASLAMP